MKECGGNHCRLRHIGWEQSGHGLASRPRENMEEPLLDELLLLFGHSFGLGWELLKGRELKLDCCKTTFAKKIPSPGHVASLLAHGFGGAGLGGVHRPHTSWASWAMGAWHWEVCGREFDQRRKRHLVLPQSWESSDQPIPNCLKSTQDLGQVGEPTCCVRDSGNPALRCGMDGSTCQVRSLKVFVVFHRPNS